MIPVSDALRTALESPNIHPIRLFRIGGTPDLLFTDADRPVMYQSNLYNPRGVIYNRLTQRLGMEVTRYVVAIDNIDDFLISWSLANDPTGKITTVWKGITNSEPTPAGHLTLIGDEAIKLFSGRNTSISGTSEFEITVSSAIDLYRQIGPRSTQDTTCRFRGINGFKGPNCGYTGPATSCNYTEATCRSYGNFSRFGGFPDLNTKTSS